MGMVGMVGMVEVVGCLLAVGEAGSSGSRKQSLKRNFGGFLGEHLHIF